MSKVLVIQQWFGLGDIIWGQTIANDFIKAGYKILWPAKKEWVDGLRRAYPAIEFIDHELVPIDYENKKFYEKNGFTYLPMRFSESLMGKPYKFHMESKYSFLGKDWRTWREHAMPKRDRRKEEMLFDRLGIEPMEEYNFVATNFGSAGSREIEIVVNNDFKNIHLKPIEGFSLFDWCGVIERASEIHAVSSSTLYLFELLNLEAKSIHLYCRKPLEQNFDYVSFLFTKPYILHV